MNKPLIFLLLLSQLFSFNVSAQEADQREEILYFRSDVAVSEDGSLTVTETITVHAEGSEIRHGIYRDFPTAYRDHLGNSYTVDFSLLETTRDDQPEESRQESIDETFGTSSVRIYIGKSDVLLSRGDYTYTIKYRVTREIGFFADHDELYWNVTGNGWAFPIRKVEASVTLPIRTNDVRLEAYTGIQGAKGRDYRARQDPDSGKLFFETTAPLGSGEGLTIVVMFPKGLVHEPTREEKLHYFLSDNFNVLVGAFGLLLALVLYIIMWLKVGVDPSAGTTVPIYDAPKDMSPADIRYLWKMSYDNKGLGAVLLDFAVKGAVKISIEDNIYTLTKTNDPKSLEKLTSLERSVFDILPWSSGSVSFGGGYNPKIGQAQQTLKNLLKKKHLGKNFLVNTAYLLPGIILSILALVGVVVFSPVQRAGIMAFLTLWLSGWTAGVVVLLIGVVTAWKNAFQAGSSLFIAIFISLFALPFFAAEITVVAILASISAGYVALVIAAGLMGYLFCHLMKSRTLPGRKLLDQIEGLRMYLGTAEQERLGSIYREPARTPEVFEKYLPFALALDVEQIWAEKFSDVLAASGTKQGADGGGSYGPSWYSGTTYPGAAAFASSIGSSLGSAISSSSTAPGSSSGGGGGGSSGGGGGGGGGGGW